MGYALVFGTCYSCLKPFGFNPHRVPSVRIDGTREPFCRDCINEANDKRADLGLTKFPVHPDAYEPIEESEL
jgi:hypothetical protein